MTWPISVHRGTLGQVAQEIVALTTLDAVVAALRLDRLDFIKADIEGWEVRLLHGAGTVCDDFGHA